MTSVLQKVYGQTIFAINVHIWFLFNWHYVKQK